MNASSRLTTLTRVGFATRGALYIAIAFLVVRTGRAEDPSGALRYLGEGGGRVLLAVMAAGLLAYGIWRAADAIFDIERHGSDGKGIAERLGAAASGVVHLLLTWQAIRLFQGVASSGQATEEGTQTALSLPGGSAIVIVGALLLFAVGVFQLVRAVKGTFLRHLEPRIARQTWAQWCGRGGYAARGLIFMISSYFLLKAGMQDQASEAGGMAQAISWLSSPVDVIVAAGLFGFGIFSLIEARYRILHDVPVDDAVKKATS
ncbi:DUF1206 domain-containing protein [Novosphingobium sp. RD2P27]|uniref:DUF1206 domain-containing protein n=1 Tax=Novosphingobium kalidii TaxID=3230299 RepID=A0ABV2D2V9_9SPHN